MPKNAVMPTQVVELIPDQVIHDLLNHRLKFFKKNECFLDCSIEEFVTTPSLWPLLSESNRQYLTHWVLNETSSACSQEGFLKTY